MTSVFYPRYSFISDITLGQFSVITFTADCDFTDGEIVSFRVSREAGSREFNNQQARVLSHTNNTITVDIDSTNYTPFISLGENQLVFPSMVVPAGSGIIPGQATATINLQDAFDNVPTN
jgi:hypothetical protein